MRNRWLPVRFAGSFRFGCLGLLFGLGIPILALAQTGSTTSNAPQSGVYVGLGGSYNSVNFGTQNVYAVGTSNVYKSGSLYSTGSAAGPADIGTNSQNNFSPSIQVGYFRHFPGSDWLWGAKFSYSYLGATSTVPNANLPQAGAFTYTGTSTPVPFTGYATVQSYQNNIRHQMALMPFIGHSFTNSFVYLGAGPTLSLEQTKLNGIIGYATINGALQNISGAPISFSSSKWVLGGALVVGGTYFFAPSWFLDLSYMFAITSNQNGNYFSPFTNPNGAGGSIVDGTLVGNSSGKVIAQGVMLTINKTF